MIGENNILTPLLKTVCCTVLIIKCS